MAANAQHVRLPVASADSFPDEADDLANRKRFVFIILIVTAFTLVSLAAYLFLRPHNRHLELTPYEDIISQFRSGMSEPDVMAIFKTAIQEGQWAEITTYDKADSAAGPRHIAAYRMRGDEPLEVRFAVGGDGRIAEWCYRDHCHDNIY